MATRKKAPRIQKAPTKLKSSRKSKSSSPWKDKRVFAGAAAIIVLAVAGLFAFTRNGAKSDSNKPLTKVTVRLNWINNAQFTGMYTAVQKGFYKDAGLDVTLKEYTDGVSQADEVANGQAQFAIAAPIELLGNKNLRKLKSVAAVYQISPHAFVSLKSANINSPADFAGKTLGMKGGNDEAKLKYLTWNNKYNITNDKLVPLDYSMTEVEDLQKGRADIVDLYRTDQIYAFKQAGVDYDLLQPENYGITGYGDMVITSQNMITEQPELVQNFVAATLKGWDYALSNQEEALTYTAMYESQDYKDKEREKFILKQSAPLIQTANKKLGQMDFQDWNESAARMKTSGLLDKNFDVSTAYTTQFLSN